MRRLFLILLGLLAARHAAAEEGLQDPFSPQSLEADRQQAWRSPPTAAFFEPNALKLVGTMTRGTQRHAILQDPLQRVHLVTLGSLIGNQRWRISHIDERHLLLSRTEPTAPSQTRTLRLQMEAP